MKRIILFIIAITGVCISMFAQNYVDRELFKNEKLGIFHTIKDGKDAMFMSHYLTFENYTNYKIRVTYKAKVRVFGVQKDRRRKEFTYTNTVYVKPNSVTLDDFWAFNKEIQNFISSLSEDIYFENYCRLLFLDFELINYGVDKKNYETTY